MEVGNPSHLTWLVQDVFEAPQNIFILFMTSGNDLIEHDIACENIFVGMNN